MPAMMPCGSELSPPLLRRPLTMGHLRAEGFERLQDGRHGVAGAGPAPVPTTS